MSSADIFSFIFFRTYCAFLSLSISLIMENFQPLYFQIVLFLLLCIFFSWYSYSVFFTLSHVIHFCISLYCILNNFSELSSGLLIIHSAVPNLLYNPSTHFQIILYFYFYAFYVVLFQTCSFNSYCYFTWSFYVFNYFKHLNVLN